MNPLNLLHLLNLLLPHPPHLHRQPEQVDEAARRRDIAVPEQFSIVVLGNHIRAAQTERRFTSFLIPREAMGRAATEMLVRRVENAEPIQQILLPCEPVEGETLGPPLRTLSKTRP